MRLWAVSEVTKTPLPRFSEDDVVDFCVKEAIAVRAGAERRMAEKQREAKDWQAGDTSHLESVSG